MGFLVRVVVFHVLSALLLISSVLYVYMLPRATNVVFRSHVVALGGVTDHSLRVWVRGVDTITWSKAGSSEILGSLALPEASSVGGAVTLNGLEPHMRYTLHVKSKRGEAAFSATFQTLQSVGVKLDEDFVFLFGAFPMSLVWD